MSIDELAEVVKQITDTERIGLSGARQDTIVVIGHSMGGYITLAFAEKYPELLKGFGLFHSTAFADSEEKKENRQKGIGFIQKHGAYEFLKPTITNLYSSYTKEHNPEIIEEQLKTARNFSAQSLVSYYEAMIARPDRTHVLKNSQVPVLFILGKWDTAVPLKDGLKQCHMPEISYIHILERSGHMGMREEVYESNSILTNYLHNL